MTLDDMIAKVGSGSTAAAIQALKLAEDLVRDPAAPLLPVVDKLALACVMQQRLIFTVHLSENVEEGSRRYAEVIRLCKHLLSCLLNVATSRPLALQISTPVLQEVVMDLVTRLLDERLETLEEGVQIARALNMILLRLMENVSRNTAFLVLLRILSDAQAGKMAVASRFSELIMKCVWKLTKTLPDVIDSIRVDELLYAVHMFLEVHPPAVWRTPSDDTPHRTMKTILHTLVKLKGVDLISDLTLVGETPIKVAVGSYLILMLRREGRTEQELMSRLPTPRPLPRHLTHRAGSGVQLLPPSHAEEDEDTGSRTAPVSPTVQEQVIVGDEIFVASPGVSQSMTLPLRGRHASSDAHGAAPPGGVQLRVPRTPRAEQNRDSVLEFARMEARAQSNRLSLLMEMSDDKEPLSATQQIELLRNILGRVTSKETTKQALDELKLFHLRHPNIDVMAYCDELSAYMQSYVQRKLEEAREEATQSRASSAASKLTGGRAVKEPASADPAAYLQQLKQLQTQVPLDPSSPQISFQAAPMQEEGLSDVSFLLLFVGCGMGMRRSRLEERRPSAMVSKLGLHLHHALVL
jgi:cytoskeleton-associated protein 5